MAGAIHKMAVYLGLVEDDRHYEDGYDGYEDEYAEYSGEAGNGAAVAGNGTSLAGNGAAVAGNGTSLTGNGASPGGNGTAVAAPAVRPGQVTDLHSDPASPAPARQPADLTRITTLHPRTYNEARAIGEHFREGIPVIMNLTEMVDSDAKRLVDFAAGLIFGLRGSIERVTNKVFLLSPANIEVTAEDKARIAERGFFNQS
jgi:cell division inhibitor SepF